MPRVIRPGPLGTAFALLDVWRRLPPHRRSWVLKQARAHGPRLARQVWAAQRARRR